MCIYSFHVFSHYLYPTKKYNNYILTQKKKKKKKKKNNNCNFKYCGHGNHVSLRHPVHSYCIQHHRIPSTNVKSGSCSGTKAVRFRGNINCSFKAVALLKVIIMQYCSTRSAIILRSVKYNIEVRWARVIFLLKPPLPVHLTSSFCKCMSGSMPTGLCPYQLGCTCAVSVCIAYQTPPN